MKPSCGAKTRSGHPCRKEAGWGTDHFGEGRCRLHGGKVGRQFKHGQYATVTKKTIRDLANELEADPEPLNVLPELALARALLLDWLNRYGELDAYSDRPPDPLEARPLIEGISKIVYRIERTKNAKAISPSDLYRIMAEMGRAVDTVVADENQKAQIKDAWLNITLT